MAGESNQQSQIQQQSINISVASSGDVDLERRIFSEVHSAGRQLQRLSEIVDVLLTRELKQDGSLEGSKEAKAAIDDFRKMREDILKAKSAFQPDRVIEQLDALRQVDSAAFDKARTQLLDWLDKHTKLDTNASLAPMPAPVPPLSDSSAQP